MKKSVILRTLFSVVLLMTSVDLFADEANSNNDQSQEEALSQRENSASKTVDFLNSHSSFTKYEYYALPDVGKGSSRIGNEVVIITDVVNNEKIGCLRVSNSGMLQNYGYGFFRNRYACVLDLDELDDLVKSCEYIQSDVLKTEAEVPTVIKFKTLDGLSLVVAWPAINSGFYTDKGWDIFIKTDPYDNDSNRKINIKYFPQFIQNLKDAKEVILSKLE